MERRYLVQSLRKGRGSTRIEPNTISTHTRIKEAKGQAKMQRNSLGELLLEQFPFPFIFNYFESEDHYIFLIEDEIGICHEAHIYLIEGIGDAGA